jgi:alpha-L-fucosidase 2
MVKKFFLLLLFTLCVPQINVNGQMVSKMDTNINWKSFLSLHDLIWEKTPNDYFNAPFIGNGLLGAMIYQPDGEPLRMDIGRTDVVDHRNSEARSIVDNGRLPIGHFTFETNGSLQNLTGRLSLYDAEAFLNAGYSLCREGCGRNVEFSFRVLRSTDAILVDYKMPEEMQGQWMFHPESSVVYRNPIEGRRHLNPVPELSVSDGLNLCVQKRDAGGCYVTAWKIVKTADGKMRLLCTIQDSYPDFGAVDKAKELIRRLESEGEVDRQIHQHRAWWNDFYQRSFVSVPHKKMESVYWIQQYKFASMMRKNGPLCDLMGPWYKQTGWPGIWWNLNTQMLYSSLHISNQMELASTLPEYLIKMNHELIAAVPEKWQYNSAGVSRCTGPAMQESILTWPSVESPERSNLTYLCYYLWEYYRTNMDENYLRNHLFPLLKRSVNLILHEVTTDENGIIHTPLGHCPESSDDPDNNYDLSSLMWGCQTLLKINKQLKLKDPLEKKWQEVVENLLPFPSDENGYRSSVNKSAPLMHRHWCHLFQFYPYYVVNREQPENRDVILKSIKFWGSPKIPNTWTQSVISSMYSSIGDGEKALEHLNLALASPNFFPNTFHAEGRNPCSETYGGLCRMLQDMLIQSWGGKIRIFPAVPDEWKDAVFHNLRAEGGFEVSAKRENGKTVWIRIKNNAGEPCVVEPGFESEFIVKGGKLAKVEPGVFKLAIKKGEEAFLLTEIQNENPVLQPVKGTEEYNSYGFK